jgi:hypothetical protein
MGEEVYIDKIQKLGWDDLLSLWQAIKSRKTPGWAAGKAFEYLVLRALQLNAVEVHWPYNVVQSGQILEQIDGAAYINGLPFLVESKDYQDRINIEPIAKLKSQLSRRPMSTMGILFSQSGFTEPALTLAQFLGLPTILLWNGDEIEYALINKNFANGLMTKYRRYVEFGLPDYNITLEKVQKAHLLTSSSLAANLYKRILPGQIVKNIEILAVPQTDKILSLAHSLLAVHQVPVSVVIDAETENEQMIAERQELWESSFRQLVPEVKFKVFQVAPEQEILFFQDTGLAKSLITSELSSAEIAKAQTQPRKILIKAFKEKETSLEKKIESLTSDSLKSIRSNKMITDMVNFFARTLEK